MRRLRTIALAATFATPLAALADSADPTGAPARSTAAGSAAGTAGTGAGSTAGIAPFQLEVREGVEFSQVAFDMGEGPILSDWARVEVDPALVARITDRPSGFVNVITDQGWVARNLPVETRPSFGRAFARARIVDDGGSLPLAFYFDLGTADAMPVVTAIVAFTEMPVLDVDALGELEGLPPVSFPLVKAVQTLSSGIVDGFVPQGPGGMPPPPPNPQIQMPEHLEGYWAVHTPNPVNVDAGRNQCAPMAVANALKYTELTFGASTGFFSGDIHVKSTGGGGIGLAGRIDDTMNRSQQGTCVGSGVGFCIDQDSSSGMFSGALAQIESANPQRLDQITVRYQGDDGDSCATDYAVSTADGGPVVTFDWLCDRIAAGDGVSLAYLRYGIDPDAPAGPIYPGMYEVPTGGHAIRVHGCGEMGGRPFIKVLNDTRQDRMDEGLCVERAGLESQLVYVEDIDYDGKLNYGDNPMWEIEFALAVSVSP